ncbi:MAG: OmpA family protein [Patiriisocius sp.]|uniref:OmpA family protein n=1 Tax=Patiriisocius sp. TaxID=2822396 RepID=UPI003EFA9609
MKTHVRYIFVFFTISCFSQSQIRKADKLFDSNAFTAAAEEYNSYIEDENNISAEIYLKAADANYNINEMRKAVTYYEKASSEDKLLSEPYLKRYVHSLRSIREYDKADAIFTKHLAKNGNTEALSLYNEEIKAFRVLEADTQPSRYSLTNVEINSKYSDFANIIYKNQLIFSSSRPGAAKELYAWNEQPYLSQFVSNQNEDGSLGEPKLFASQAGSKFHDSTLAIVPESNDVYYTSNTLKKNKLVLDDSNNNNFSLYKGKIEDGKITGKEILFFDTKDYCTGHPSVSDDGKYLFFASDMPGGFGEADIYYCKIYDDGKLSSPVNAGAKINTAGNDFFPVFKENILYFSSNGHVGFGGIDIYEAKFEENKTFSIPENLGKTVNTSYDDFHLIFNKNENTGYFSSNREGGKGDDDIYYFERAPLPCDQYISGTIIDKLSKKKLEGVLVTVTDSLDSIMQTVLTDVAGRYQVKIPCKNKITILATKEKYLEKFDTITTGDINEQATPEVNFELNKIEDIIIKDEKGVEKIKMDPIFFEYNKAEVTPEAALVLNKAAEVMKEIPNMVIKIEAHTDSRGASKYNLDLSDRRAKATQTYLYEQGIAIERIESANGFGESRPLNKCVDGVRCSDEEYDINRRSDFIIIKK